MLWLLNRHSKIDVYKINRVSLFFSNYILENSSVRIERKFEITAQVFTSAAVDKSRRWMDRGGPIL